MIRVYGFDVRNRAAAMALVALALAIGAVLLAFGILLLLGLAAAGTVIGASLAAFRALTGRGGRRLRSPRGDADLDPALEVFPRQANAEPPRELPR